MKIAVVGTGYVGLVTGTCFAEMGNTVYCVDTNEEKIAALNEGKIPIYEPGLEALVKNNRKLGHLNFVTSLEEILEKVEIVFIAVGTPQGEDGSADLQYVKKVAETIGKNIRHHLYVVTKSTVPVGTAETVRKIIQAEIERRKPNMSLEELAACDFTFDMVSNPEFLKEGNAVGDCLKPDRIIIGVDSYEVGEVMRELYTPYVRNTEALIFMDIASAEMTKYAANAMLATKISFMNEMGRICELVGADVNKVRLGIGSDKRIGYSFIYPGCGYGGSCFPKDVKALIGKSKEFDYTPQILNAVENVNAAQKFVLPQKIFKRFGEDLTGKTFAVWGLSFKPDTDDMREAPSITLITELVKHGATVNAYDPKAMDEAKNFYLKDFSDKINYVESKYEALKRADALILVTEWKEFRQPDFAEIISLLNNPVIFDGRNQYDKKRLKKSGIEYHQIGVAD